MDIISRALGISGGYLNHKVIDNLSLDLKGGCFLGIIGPNGSGKSTFLKMMSRSLQPWEGAVEFGRKDIWRMRPKEFSRKVSFVSQETMINFSFSVREVVLMGRIPHLARFEPEGGRDFSAAEEALTLTDALYLKDKEIDSLSAGERQRVMIARSLAQEPELLYLDEPTSHLDIGHQIQILDLMKNLNRDKGLSVVVVLHDLNLAGEYCDEIVLLDKGRIFKKGPPEDVLTYRNIEAVYKTVVVVNKNPISSKPFITLVSAGALKCQRVSSS